VTSHNHVFINTDKTITSVVKVSPDFVTNITARSIGLVEILVIMYVFAFKSDVILYGVELVYGV
jgi:hypothetical protein